MRAWDWIVLAAIAEGTLALVLVVLVRRRTNGVAAPHGPEARFLEDEDEDDEDEDHESRPLRRRHRPAVRGRTGEVSVRLVPLSSAARDRYVRQWLHLRAEFVEEPGRTTERADDVIQDLMFDRGFPVEELEDAELPIAPEHRVVVENFRIAHRLAAGARRANTEQLRLAMLHFRVVVEELLEDPPYDLSRPKRPRRRRRAGRAQPDVGRYRVAVTDEGPDRPRSPEPRSGRAVS